ncbi:McrB family protein [Vibrio artabrorum]|uniref:McrB family protein n=1 Tax=Vibrio artabrorum TaxID=446374 RepID=UPI00354B87A2
MKVDISQLSESQKQLLLHFKEVESFEKYYLGWPHQTIVAFCVLLEQASRSGIDLYTVGPGAQQVIRLGRKEQGASTGKVFATFEPQKERLKFELRYKQQHNSRYNRSMGQEILDFLSDGNYLSDYIQEYPISRLSFWPNDYQQQSVIEMSNISPVQTISTPNPLNQIFYGPPGTGKTYKLQQLQAEYTSQTESADASLWLQEKIALLNWMQVLVLSLLSLGKKAKVSDIVASKYFQTKAKVNNRDGNLSQTAWSYLQKFTVSNSTTVNYKGRGEPAVFDKTSDSVWHLLDDKLELVDELLVLHKELEQGPPPGTVVKRFSSTTFHQSYGYEEFIEGLRASTDGEGNVHYSVEPGEFLKLCRRAEQDPDSQYAMFIDEINRGNISKIFGELISLVETDKRKDGAHPMSVNLAYSGRPFSVPSNVDIIGTMNTADRSIALMDTALRRRFEFIEMMPDIRLFESDGLIDIGNNQHIDLAELLKSLNDRIEALYDREHTLGHAFFFPAYNAAKAGNHDEALSNLAKAFIGKIVPLLQEYFHDNWSKIRLVLGDNQKLGSDRKELQALQFVRREKVEYQRLFGNQYEPDGYASDEYRYTLADQNDDIWTNGECYLAIYKPQLTEVLAAQVMDEN